MYKNIVQNRSYLDVIVNDKSSLFLCKDKSKINKNVCLFDVSNTGYLEQPNRQLNVTALFHYHQLHCRY